MSYAYKEDGILYLCNVASSIPDGLTAIEAHSFPDGPMGCWDIVNGVLVVDADKLALHEHQLAKEARQVAVENIVVTVDLMDFDGDEVSQGRMARAIASSAPGDITTWVLADNTPAAVTHEQLKQALRLAGEAQTALWVI